MANIRLIKRRIKTAKNIAQITKAMELVSAAKMKKAQSAALAGKLYAQKIQEMVMLLSRKTDFSNHPLLTLPEHPTGKQLCILISTNKGLCGGLNSNLFRMMRHTYMSDKHIEFVTMGRKGADFTAKTGHTVIADFSSSDFRTVVPAIIKLVEEKFVSGQYDAIDLMYNDFISIMVQKPTVKTILPLTIGGGAQLQETSVSTQGDFLIEPDVESVFNRLLPHYLENQVWDAVNEAAASEHSARMVAMRNATDNALTLTDELTLIYNKVRQEKITYEINDIVTAKAASSA